MISAKFSLPVCLVLVGIGTGLLWRQPSIGRRDALLMQRINHARLPGLADQSLAVLRLAGTTVFFIAVLVLVAVVHASWALGLVVAAVAAEAITMLLKIAFHRERPFAVDAGVVIRLPRLPIDPSYPSADAMRAAFLAGVTLAGRAVPSWVSGLAIVAAISVGYGRVRSGAHFPLDVWAGLTVGFGAVLAWAGTL
jgi:membrane-associated phospholipid phosphatase